MQWAKLAAGSCTVLALAAITVDADAGKGRGGLGAGGHGASGATARAHPAQFGHHFHGGTRVFVGLGAGYAYWPAPYYYWPGYYYGPPVALQYWYYCTAAAAYYPYVQNCPGGWELVTPAMPQPY